MPFSLFLSQLIVNYAIRKHRLQIAKLELFNRRKNKNKIMLFYFH